MTKKEAIKLLKGKTLDDLGKALGGKTRQAISQWPDILDEDKKNMVLGAALRKGIKIPKELLH